MTSLGTQDGAVLDLGWGPAARPAMVAHRSVSPPGVGRKIRYLRVHSTYNICHESIFPEDRRLIIAYTKRSERRKLRAYRKISKYHS